MKKLLLIAALLGCFSALRAESTAPLTAESQRAYFKVYDRIVLAMVQQRKDLIPDMMKEMARLGEAGDPRAAFQYAMYYSGAVDYEKGCAMAGKLFPELLALAQKDDWLACQSVGGCYAYGIGCKRDEAAADRWIKKSQALMKKAAENDDPVALIEQIFNTMMMGSDDKKAEAMLHRLQKHDSKFAEYALKIIAEEKKRSGK